MNRCIATATKLLRCMTTQSQDQKQQPIIVAFATNGLPAASEGNTNSVCNTRGLLIDGSDSVGGIVEGPTTPDVRQNSSRTDVQEGAKGDYDEADELGRNTHIRPATIHDSQEKAGGNNGKGAEEAAASAGTIISLFRGLAAVRKNPPSNSIHLSSTV
jgi:hypothetical protein